MDKEAKLALIGLLFEYMDRANGDYVAAVSRRFASQLDQAENDAAISKAIERYCEAFVTLCNVLPQGPAQAVIHWSKWPLSATPTTEDQAKALGNSP